MLKPTQDKTLPRKLETIHIKYCGGDDFTMIMEMLKLIEKEGYYKGLPPDIEWALNSGDGVYRP